MQESASCLKLKKENMINIYISLPIMKTHINGSHRVQGITAVDNEKQQQPHFKLLPEFN